MSKCGSNKKVTHKVQQSVSLVFLPHFDVVCDLLQYRPMVTLTLFFKMKKQNAVISDVIYVSVFL